MLKTEQLYSAAVVVEVRSRAEPRARAGTGSNKLTRDPTRPGRKCTGDPTRSDPTHMNRNI